MCLVYVNEIPYLTQSFIVKEGTIYDYYDYGDDYWW